MDTHLHSSKTRSFGGRNNPEFASDDDVACCSTKIRITPAVLMAFESSRGTFRDLQDFLAVPTGCHCQSLPATPYIVPACMEERLTLRTNQRKGIPESTHDP